MDHTTSHSFQAAHAVVMVRPHTFTSNPETQGDNSFQQAGPADQDIAALAQAEVTAAVAQLETAGVRVHVFEDDGTRNTPDSVFPNNWFSTHASGKIALYPMYAENRRRERRTDIIDALVDTYRVTEITDYSPAERDNIFLEGTGAIVFDHLTADAYIARSKRADDELAARYCAQFGYRPVLFDTQSPDGSPVYHTNVIMCIGTHFALVGSSYFRTDEDRDRILGRLRATGRDVIELTQEQIEHFAGNALELSGTNGLVVAMSTTARAALTPEQVRIIEQYARIEALDVPTIELAGGSVRCMLAGIHLPPRV